VTRRINSPLAAQILGVAAIAAPLTVGAATSDVATGVEGESAPNELQEIIVTAQKRTEDIKNIPFSVSAISGAELAEHHVADYDDITRTVPGIGFQAGPGPGLDNIEIRGVSSTSGSATVGIYIDEVSVTVSNSLYDGAVQAKLFDLERIEVLRGPQGTLYGASSMGGTIRFITKQPDLNSFSATVSTDLSGTHHGGFNNDEYGILNIPVIDDVFALRIGVDLANESGYIDHYIPTPSGAGPDGSILEPGTNDSTGVRGERGVNDVRTQVFRVVGKYAAPDDWTITPAYLWQRVATSDTNIFYPDIGLYDQDKRVAEPYTDDLNLPSLTVTKSFGWAELTSVTSYFKRDFRRTTDGTLYNSNIFANSYVVGGLSSATNPPTPPATAQQIYETQTVLGFLASPAGYDARTEQFSQELRLSSKSTSIAGVGTNWTAGLYFANQRRRFLDDEYIPGLQTTFQNIYGYGIYTPQSVVGPSYYAATAAYPAESFANDLIYYGHLYPKQKQIAPFVDVGFEITPSLKGTVGVRYVSAKSTEFVNSGGFYSYGLPATYNVNENFSATTPKFSLDYALNASSNLYATIAKGFRLGGPTGPVPAYEPNGPPPATPGTCDTDYRTFGLTGAPDEYQSDSLWSYELGSKGRYFDNRLSINAAVYAINWTAIQQTINLPTCGFNFTTNVGDAKIYGSELEVRALVTPNMTLSLNAGSTHAYITSVSAEGSGIVYPGEWVLNVPLYTVTPSFDYDAPVDDRMSVFVRGDFPYTGRSRGYFDSSGLPHVFQPGYGIVNMSVGFKREKLSVSLYVKNLLNWKNIIQYPSVNSVQEGYTVRPATFGITATLEL
jgi:outer membrane receptor protein involved in Fe transport